jgi:hypothetical protein
LAFAGRIAVLCGEAERSGTSGTGAGRARIRDGRRPNAEDAEYAEDAGETQVLFV